MNEATTIRVGGAERPVRPAAGEGKGRRLRWRHLWLVPGLAIAIFANELGKANGVGILVLIAFGIAPDVPRLFGIGRSGRVSRFALRAFNVLHHPAAPAAAVADRGDRRRPGRLARGGACLAQPPRDRLGCR